MAGRPVLCCAQEHRGVFLKNRAGRLQCKRLNERRFRGFRTGRGWACRSLVSVSASDTPTRMPCGPEILTIMRILKEKRRCHRESSRSSGFSAELAHLIQNPRETVRVQCINRVADAGGQMLLVATTPERGWKEAKPGSDRKGGRLQSLPSNTFICSLWASQRFCRADAARYQ